MKIKKMTITIFLLLSYIGLSQGFHEGFEDVEALITNGGWARRNLSNTTGNNPNWRQGNSFSAYTMPANSYAMVTATCVLGIDTISNWLFTPNVYYENGDTFRFVTRTVSVPEFPDRMQVRLSNAGSSVNVGSSNASVGDFTILLAELNAGLSVTGYPSVWTTYEIVLSGLNTSGNGRFAFRYFVPEGGPIGDNSELIAIDEVEFIPNCSNGPVISVQSIVQPSCSNSSNGSINISFTGGMAPVNILWSNGLTSTSISNLPGSTYSVEVKDLKGCKDTAVISIVAPSPLVLSMASLPATTVSNGLASAGVSGGTPPYTYAWAPTGGNGPIATELTSGSYTVFVMDANGCQESSTIQVGSLMGITASDEISISMFPNPSEEKVTFSVESSGKIVESLEVFSLDGKKMSLPKFNPCSSFEFSVSSWSPGIYLIQATIDGEKVAVQPLIKR